MKERERERAVGAVLLPHAIVHFAARALVHPPPVLPTKMRMLARDVFRHISPKTTGLMHMATTVLVHLRPACQTDGVVPIRQLWSEKGR